MGGYGSVIVTELRRNYYTYKLLSDNDCLIYKQIIIERLNSELLKIYATVWNGFKQ